MPTILLIRHGQASFGGDDYDVLSATGHRQAAAVRADLERRGVRATRVVTGPARRHGDTARAWPDAVARVDERWDEYATDSILEHHGETELRLSGGRTPASPRQFQDLLESALAAWIAAGDDSGCRETWPGFVGRVRSAIEDLAGDLGRGETCVVVTSGGPIAAASMLLTAAGSAAFIRFSRVLVNAGVTTLVHGSRGTSLLTFNDHAHLTPAAPGLVTYR